MENSSRALIMAAAVLAVVCVIQIGVSIYNKSKDNIDATVLQITQLEVTMHNNIFRPYCETPITGDQLVECISKAILNNSRATNDTFCIKVLVDNNLSGGTPELYVSYGEEEHIEEEISARQARMSLNFIKTNKYKGTYTLNDRGMVDNITFKRIS